MAEATWIQAGPLADLTVGAPRLIKADGRQIVLVRVAPQQVHAVDNACPHEGYPLAEGYVKGCVLTCAWHNYKFDVRDGACVMGEEAVRSYPTRIVDGTVAIEVTDPDPASLIPVMYTSLEEALVENRPGQAARDVVRLLAAGIPVTELVARAALFDADRAEYGTTHALPVASDALIFAKRLEGLDVAYPIVQAFDCASDASIRMPIREVPEAIDPGDDPDAGELEFATAVESEEGERAQALLRGGLARGWVREQIEPWFFRVCAAHFLNFGHQLIYVSKVFDLLDAIGFEHADRLLPALAHRIVNGTREDTLPAMSGTRKRLDELDPRLEELHAAQKRDRKLPSPSTELSEALVHGAGRDWFALFVAALESGVSARSLLDVVSQGAAQRMLRFDPAIDTDRSSQDGWLFVTHTLSHANAVRRGLKRWPAPESLRLLFFAAHFVNRSRPLDLVVGDLTGEPAAESPATVEEVIGAIASKQPEQAVRAVRGYLAHDGVIEALEARIQDLAIRVDAGRSIIAAHVTKMTIACFEEARAIGRPSGDIAIVALVRFLASPVTERSLARVTQEAIDFVSEGRPPRVLAD